MNTNEALNLTTTSPNGELTITELEYVSGASHLLDALREIIENYNEVAKEVIHSIGGH